MNEMISKSGVQVEKGKDDGYLCSLCGWAGRSESTRLMDVDELRRHGQRVHRRSGSDLEAWGMLNTLLLIIQRSANQTKSEGNA